MTVTQEEESGHSTSRRTRMAEEARRGLVLAAATRSFARTGSADTKQDLFLATHDRAADTVHDSFAAVVGDPPFDGSREADRSRLGSVYRDLLRDRDLALVLPHGFVAAYNPAIRTRARECLGRLNNLLLEAGSPASLARDFIAHGMLLTVLMAVRAPEDPSIPPGPARPGGMRRSGRGPPGPDRVGLSTGDPAQPTS